MTVKSHIRKKKDQYLRRQGRVGGDKIGFRAFIDDDFKTHPEEYNDRQAVLATAAAVWEENTRSETDLFSIAGVTIASTLTFPDPKYEGFYRKILTEFATVYHLREDALATIDAGQKIVDAGNEKLRIANEALNRAGGAINTLISEVADRVR